MRLDVLVVEYHGVWLLHGAVAPYRDIPATSVAGCYGVGWQQGLSASGQGLVLNTPVGVCLRGVGWSTLAPRVQHL